MKISFLQTSEKLRDLINQKNPKTFMLLNTLGVSRADYLQSYDGTYSEGQAVNAVGLLGLVSTSILWTYTADECCSSQKRADNYFQIHLYMGVYPMAPFPENDHSIDPGTPQLGYYVQYGPLFAAITGHEWVFIEHAVSSMDAKVNAFYIPFSAEYVFPVVLIQGSEPTISVVISAMLFEGCKNIELWGIYVDSKEIPLSYSLDGEKIIAKFVVDSHNGGLIRGKCISPLS